MKSHVTILCGFLGAGKTTLLNHLLRQAEGRRWAAIVNDVAAINIDAALVRDADGRPAGASETAARRDIVALGNGCVCCSSKDELAESIAELAMTGHAGGPPGEPFEHILVETTGVAEPRALATLFTRKNPFGRTLSDFAVLSALVTVVDAPAFLREWTRYEARRVSRETLQGGERPVFELMIEQAECADVLLINKSDLLADAGARAQVEAILAGLNARAERLVTERSQVASEFLLERVRFDATATLGGAAWVRALNAAAAATPAAPVAGSDPGARAALKPRVVAPAAGGYVLKPKPADAHARPSHEVRFGITSFVYQARRPFVRAKFRQLIESGLPGLLRAKGFYWTREQPDEMGFVSVAGGVARFDTLNYWWAALVENGKARLDARPESIRALWVEPHGDRRQELVFIGVGLDEAAVRAALDACCA